MPTDRKRRTPERPGNPALPQGRPGEGQEAGLPAGDPVSTTAAALVGHLMPGADTAAPREARVRRRAYELWERAGRPDGAHEAHWHEAGRQIDGEDGAGKDPADGSREVADANLARAERDAAPQFVRTRRGSRNSGMVSAVPRVISGDETGDATFPLEQGGKKG